MPHLNLALELLKKLLNDEIKTQSRCNMVESRPCRERWNTRPIEMEQIIVQLIDLAKEMRATRQRGEELG